MYKILALFGESGAGKDTIQKFYVDHAPVHGIVSATTRPPREYEQDSVDYYFITKEEFSNKVIDGTMLEATSFGEEPWWYGTPIESLDENKINVGVFNLQGIQMLLEDPRIQVYPIYVRASNKTRLLRALNREQSPDCKEICRRFLQDEKDFDTIPFEYHTFMNTDDGLSVTGLMELLDGFMED